MRWLSLSQSFRLKYLISLSGRGKPVMDLSLFLPICLRILNLHRWNSGRGDTARQDICIHAKIRRGANNFFFLLHVKMKMSRIFI